MQRCIKKASKEQHLFIYCSNTTNNVYDPIQKKRDTNYNSTEDGDMQQKRKKKTEIEG